MTKATWNGATLAASTACIVVEGVHYFPPESVDRRYIRPSPTHTICSWKGVASYYDVVVDDQVNPDAAWYYPYPKPAARNVKAYVAFWRGVTIVDTDDVVQWRGATASSHGAGLPVSERDS
jgi:uncharacterized protein (DUF427 family)